MWLAASAARADSDAEAWELLQRGTELYQKGDYRAARVALVRARELVPGRVPAIDRWLGLTDAQMGDCTDAVVELDRFLAASTAEADTALEATRARDGCKQALATHGRLRIVTWPAGAEVRIDADDPKTPPIGISPVTLESAPLGDHLVSVQHSGYQPATRIVSIAAGQLASVELTLASLTTAPSTAAPPGRLRRRRWLWPVVVMASVAIIGVAVGVGVGVGTASKPSFPTLTFQ